MSCEEKQRLLKVYSLATEHYSWSVNEMQEKRATASQQAYKDLYAVVEDARKQCEVARKKLESHTAGHGC